MKLTKKEQAAILEIAKECIYGMRERGDFEARMRDDDDFLDIAVWALQEAMEKSYALGKKNGGK